MPHELPQPFDLVAGPARYPQPDYEGTALVVRVYVPHEQTVGYALFQDGRALAWISDVGPAHLGYPIRRHVGDILRSGASTGVPAGTAWAQLLAATLHTPPAQMALPALLADIREQWGSGR